MATREELIGKEISELYRMGNIFLSKRFSKYEIGSGQYLFLVKLYRYEGISQEKLSEMVNIDKATTARAITKLEDQGYVIRIKCNEDKRINKIYLTDKAKNIKDEFFNILGEWNEILMKSLNQDERKQIMYLLNKISTTTDRNEGNVNE